MEAKQFDRYFPSKPQHPCSRSSLCGWPGGCRRHMRSANSDQTVQMHRLIRVFVDRPSFIVGFVIWLVCHLDIQWQLLVAIELNQILMVMLSWRVLLCFKLTYLSFLIAARCCRARVRVPVVARRRAVAPMASQKWMITLPGRMKKTISTRMKLHLLQNQKHPLQKKKLHPLLG